MVVCKNVIDAKGLVRTLVRTVRNPLCAPSRNPMCAPCRKPLCAPLCAPPSSMCRAQGVHKLYPCAHPCAHHGLA